MSFEFSNFFYDCKLKLREHYWSNLNALKAAWESGDAREVKLQATKVKEKLPTNTATVALHDTLRNMISGYTRPPKANQIKGANGGSHSSRLDAQGTPKQAQPRPLQPGSKTGGTRPTAGASNAGSASIYPSTAGSQSSESREKTLHEDNDALKRNAETRKGEADEIPFHLNHLARSSEGREKMLQDDNNALKRNAEALKGEADELRLRLNRLAKSSEDREKMLQEANDALKRNAETFRGEEDELRLRLNRLAKSSKGREQSLQEDNDALKQNAETLKGEADELRLRLNRLAKSSKGREQSLQEDNDALKRKVEKLQGEADEIHLQMKGELDTSREALKRMEDRLKISSKKPNATEPLPYIIQRIDEKVGSILQDNSSLNRLIQSSESPEQSLQEDNDALKQTVETLKGEADDLRLRLSKIAGAKLSENYNPNVPDLSDPYRPTKLADMYSELYDYQWTDAFDALTNTQKLSERAAIDVLLAVVQRAYTYSSEAAQTQDVGIKVALMYPVNMPYQMSSKVDEIVDISKGLSAAHRGMVTDLRKQIAANTAKNLVKDFFKDISKTIRLSGGDNKSLDLNEEHCRVYVEACLILCFHMCVQSPPVYIDTGILKQGTTYNRAIYKPYTKFGKYVDFVVWPLLQLQQDGDTLAKGVAQGC